MKNLNKSWEDFLRPVETDMSIDNARLIRRLEKPKGRVDVVIDTDTYNEIDDQYALSYLIKSDEKLDLKAIYAAPFFNEKSTRTGRWHGEELSGDHECPYASGT